MAGVIADNWPSFTAELSRKALTTLEKWMKIHDAGKITVKELYVIADALYDTISGLADEETTRAVGAVHEEIRRMAARART